MEHLPDVTERNVQFWPAVPSAGTANGTGWDASQFESVEAMIAVGAIPVTATVNMHVEESDVLGSGYADISGAAITELGADDDNTQATIRISMKGRKKYLRMVVITANDDSYYFGEFIGYRPQGAQAMPVRAADVEV